MIAAVRLHPARFAAGAPPRCAAGCGLGNTAHPFAPVQLEIARCDGMLNMQAAAGRGCRCEEAGTSAPVAPVRRCGKERGMAASAGRVVYRAVLAISESGIGLIISVGWQPAGWPLPPSAAARRRSVELSGGARRRDRHHTGRHMHQRLAGRQVGLGAAVQHGVPPGAVGLVERAEGAQLRAGGGGSGGVACRARGWRQLGRGRWGTVRMCSPGTACTSHNKAHTPRTRMMVPCTVLTTLKALVGQLAPGCTRTGAEMRWYLSSCGTQAEVGARKQPCEA